MTKPTCHHPSCPHPAVHTVMSATGVTVGCCGQHLAALVRRFGGTGTRAVIVLPERQQGEL